MNMNPHSFHVDRSSGTSLLDCNRTGSQRNRRASKFLSICSCLMRLPAISLPGGTILREKTKERECWKFLDQRLISENDSCLNGQPSNAVTVQSFSGNRWLVNFCDNIPGLFSYSFYLLWPDHKSFSIAGHNLNKKIVREEKGNEG